MRAQDAEALKRSSFTQSRTRKCAVCRDVFAPRNMSHKCCGPDCGLALAAKDRLTRERKADKLKRDSMKTRSDWMKEAQVAFNAGVRERDRDKLCISCDAPLDRGGTTGGDFDCGHYRSVGSAPHLRFDERNAHGQCKKCNRYLSGNAVEYRRGLIARIGLEAVEALEADQAKRDHSIEALRAIKEQCKALLKQAK